MKKISQNLTPIEKLEGRLRYWYLTAIFTISLLMTIFVLLFIGQYNV